MNHLKKTINIIEELLRVSTLKKESIAHDTLMEAIGSTMEISYRPPQEKANHLIEELELYYNKIKPTSRFRWILPAIIGLGLAFGIHFMVKHKDCDCDKYAENESNIIVGDPSPKENNIPDTLNPDTAVIQHKQGNIKLAEIKLRTNFSANIDTQRTYIFDTIIVTDTMRNEVQIIDSVVKEVVIEEYNSQPVFNDCELPAIYKFSFNSKKYKLKRKYKEGILDLSRKIQYCKSEHNIRIKGYYHNSFIFFTNRKVVTERILEIENSIQKNGVPKYKLDNASIEYLKVKKKHDNSDELYELVEVILEE